MVVSILQLHLSLPGCTSLKEKRSQIRPLLHRLHREFNLSVAEVDLLDHWTEALVVCAVVSNDPTFNQRMLQDVLRFIEQNWPNLPIYDFQIENR